MYNTKFHVHDYKNPRRQAFCILVVDFTLINIKHIIFKITTFKHTKLTFSKSLTTHLKVQCIIRMEGLQPRVLCVFWKYSFTILFHNVKSNVSSKKKSLLLKKDFRVKEHLNIQCIRWKNKCIKVNFVFPSAAME